MQFLHNAAWAGLVDARVDALQGLQERLLAARFLHAPVIPRREPSRDFADARVVAIVGAWKRSNAVLEVVTRLQQQSKPPDQIVVWQNEAHIDIEVPLRALGVEHIRMASNGYHAARFAAVSLFDADYYVVHDDDCVPAEGWIARALACVERHNCIVGSEGRFVLSSAPQSVTQAGVYQPDEDTRVDFVGHAWVMKAAHARLIFQQAPLDRTNGADDIHLGYLAAKAGVSIYVPAAEPDADADTKRMTLGMDEHATWLSDPAHAQKRETLINAYIARGWALQQS